MIEAHPSFELLSSRSVDALNVTVSEYRHRVTGAKHVHLAADDDNNVFLVAFLTIPSDSTGVAHVLEHTALCGSEKYPVRDPFFMMLRRSLNTFMNAFTSSDWTAYPFASKNVKDFNNLLRVYLDAAFFPKLDVLDFSQEGHRVEFSTADDASSELVYKGVVFNEMKGAMSAPTSELWQQLTRLLFPTITYHHNSGGAPEDIPALTHQQLKDFHQKHYHPGNAIFMTYGNLSPESHQKTFESCALSRFSWQENTLSLGDEKRFEKPLQEQGHYPLDEEEIAEKTHIVIAWLLGNSLSVKNILEASLLNGVLLSHSASPLRQALETTELAQAPSPLCGMEESLREMVFVCGVEGSEEQQAEAVEALILSVLENVAEEGVPEEELTAVLQQLELNQREIGGDHYPYGLQLILDVLSPTLHGAEPATMLDINEALENLRRDIQDPQFIKQMVREQLLDNPHRVRLVMSPDAQLSEQRQKVEAEKLKTLQNSLTPAQKTQVMEQSALLKARQDQEDDPQVLPKVGLEDIPPEPCWVEGKSTTVADLPVNWYARGTNGLVYQQVIMPLPELSASQQDLLPIFCGCLTEVGCGGEDYLATQQRQARSCGRLSASATVHSRIDNLKEGSAFFNLSANALLAQSADMSRLLKDTLDTPDFSEHARLQELVSQMRVRSEQSITSRGHSLAMNAACQKFSAVAQTAWRWSGLAAIQGIKVLDERLKKEGCEKVSAEFQHILQSLQNAPKEFLLVAENEQEKHLTDQLGHIWKTGSSASQSSQWQLAPVAESVKQFWQTSTQVNFCAKAYPVGPSGHSDAPVCNVLAAFLRNGYLHKAVREQGGAYGGGAAYDSDSGGFRFYSYRDPRLQETLDDFDHSLDWLHNSEHSPRLLEEAILGVIGRMDQPGSPAGDAKHYFHSQLHGRSRDYLKRLRERVLNVTVADMQRVANTYLQADRASAVLISNNASYQSGQFSDWELCSI
jgi:presequence protease